MNFIGRAEKEAQSIFKKLFNTDNISSQVSLQQLIPTEEFNWLNEEVQKHKFDLYVCDFRLIIEINYKHGEKAARKWRTIFKPLLEQYHYQTLTIDDYECESLFEPQDYSKHKSSWNDYNDIINAIITQKIAINNAHIITRNLFK